MTTRFIHQSTVIAALTRALAFAPRSSRTPLFSVAQQLNIKLDAKAATRKQMLQWAKRKTGHNRARARKAGYEGRCINAQEWLDLCKFYHFRCNCCERREPDLTIDHIVPLAQGGSGEARNIQVLCTACHGFKTRLEQHEITYYIDYRETLPDWIMGETGNE